MQPWHRDECAVHKEDVRVFYDRTDIVSQSCWWFTFICITKGSGSQADRLKPEVLWSHHAFQTSCLLTDNLELFFFCWACKLQIFGISWKDIDTPPCSYAQVGCASTSSFSVFKALQLWRLCSQAWAALIPLAKIDERCFCLWSSQWSGEEGIQGRKWPHEREPAVCWGLKGWLGGPAVSTGPPQADGQIFPGYPVSAPPTHPFGSQWLH